MFFFVIWRMLYESSRRTLGWRFTAGYELFGVINYSIASRIPPGRVEREGSRRWDEMSWWGVGKKKKKRKSKTKKKRKGKKKKKNDKKTKKKRGRRGRILRRKKKKKKKKISKSHLKAPKEVPGDAQEHPEDPQETSRNHQRTQTENTQRTHREPDLYTPMIGSWTPDSSPLATRMLMIWTCWVQFW